MDEFDKAIDNWLTREYMGIAECCFGRTEDDTDFDYEDYVMEELEDGE